MVQRFVKGKPWDLHGLPQSRTLSPLTTSVPCHQPWVCARKILAPWPSSWTRAFAHLALPFPPQSWLPSSGLLLHPCPRCYPEALTLQLSLWPRTPQTEVSNHWSWQPQPISGLNHGVQALHQPTNLQRFSHSLQKEEDVHALRKYIIHDLENVLFIPHPARFWILAARKHSTYIIWFRFDPNLITIQRCWYHCHPHFSNEGNET